MQITNSLKIRAAFSLLIDKYFDLPANESPHLQKPHFELLCDACKLVAEGSNYQLKKDFYQLVLTVMLKSKNVNEHNYSNFGKLQCYFRHISEDYKTIENDIKEDAKQIRSCNP